MARSVLVETGGVGAYSPGRGNLKAAKRGGQDEMSLNRSTQTGRSIFRFVLSEFSLISPATTIPGQVRNLTFWATGITAHLENGVKLEIAEQIAAHESSRTTGLYDRREDNVSLDEVERIGI